jgi:hypothetical protein
VRCTSGAPFTGALFRRTWHSDVLKVVHLFVLLAQLICRRSCGGGAHRRVGNEASGALVLHVAALGRVDSSVPEGIIAHRLAGAAHGPLVEGSDGHQEHECGTDDVGDHILLVVVISIIVVGVGDGYPGLLEADCGRGSVKFGLHVGDFLGTSHHGVDGRGKGIACYNFVGCNDGVHERLMHVLVSHVRVSLSVLIGFRDQGEAVLVGCSITPKCCNIIGT